MQTAETSTKTCICWGIALPSQLKRDSQLLTQQGTGKLLAGGSRGGVESRFNQQLLLGDRKPRLPAAAGVAVQHTLRNKSKRR